MYCNVQNSEGSSSVSPLIILDTTGSHAEHWGGVMWNILSHFVYFALRFYHGINCSWRSTFSKGEIPAGITAPLLKRGSRRMIVSHLSERLAQVWAQRYSISKRCFAEDWHEGCDTPWVILLLTPPSKTNLCRRARARRNKSEVTAW